jgi:tRNA pseudouridine32 synthase/23S rRNA pseudouridine746 synthase
MTGHHDDLAPLPGTPDAPRQVLSVEVTLAAGDPDNAPDVLAARSGLSRLRIKDAMAKGAVWLARAGRKPERLRRVKTPLKPGDRLSLHYDSAVLALVPPPATLVTDARRYSVWLKPAGLLCEGSRFGDHATLAAQVAAHFAPRREVYLVHRLDLEASGFMIIAHSRSAAAKLSALFQARSVDKRYRIEVLGDLRPVGARGRIDLPLDGKAAVTEYAVEAWREADNRSVAHVRMLSGRYHQIRRHFEAIGHPVIGDPRYGRGNKDAGGLRLAAVGIAFEDPWSGRPVRLGEVPEWQPPSPPTPAT